MLPANTERTLKYRIWRTMNPDGKLFEFMAFIGLHWEEFFALKGMKRPHSTIGWHEEFDRWLNEKYSGRRA